jgi:hypothetical protein
VVRASGCQCRSRNSPGFGAADEAVLNTVHKKILKIPLLIIGRGVPMVAAHFCNSRRGRGGVGGRGGDFLLIENYMDYVSSQSSGMFPTPRENQRTHMEEIFNKIKNYLQV